jgi:hypothetical protein
MSLKFAVEQTFGHEVNIASGQLSAKLSQYANLLASQGALSAALSYLGNSEEESIARLRERLNGAIGRRSAAAQHQAVSAQISSSRVTGELTACPCFLVRLLSLSHHTSSAKNFQPCAEEVEHFPSVRKTASYRTPQVDDCVRVV